MNRILLFCALGAFWGCRTVNEPTTEAITLSYSTSESSKVGALTAGDEVAVFARLDGTEDYFLEAAKFATGADGQALQTTPAVYYPETKQAVNFYAYFPYHTGVFSVPSDQSTPAALKQADLCWASASSTPVPTPVSLQFEHKMARLIVSTNEPTEKIACQVVPSGTLNPATGQFTLNSTPSEVSTTGNELILPVQPLTRLVLTVANIEYLFEGSINLQTGQTTTLNLTLNPSTQTATLNGSSTTAWTASNQNGIPSEAVSNLLTLHWANYVPQGTTPDKIILTINNTDYTVSTGISYADKTFTVPFASEQLRYPYTISKIVFSTIPMPCNQLLGQTIYKSGGQTLGIKDVPNAVLINGVWWATGNLIADGPNGCKIGAPTDYGLYFQFGSLIGWAGGANGDGTGQGWPAVGVRLRPIGYTATPTWSTCPGYDKTYSTNNVNHLLIYPSSTPGVGDPCRFYLGATWQIPTADQWTALLGSSGGNVSTVNGCWSVRSSGQPLTLPKSGEMTEGVFDPRYTNCLIMPTSTSYTGVRNQYIHYNGNKGSWFVPYPNNGYRYAGAVRCVTFS